MLAERCDLHRRDPGPPRHCRSCTYVDVDSLEAATHWDDDGWQPASSVRRPVRTMAARRPTAPATARRIIPTAAPATPDRLPDRVPPRRPATRSERR